MSTAGSDGGEPQLVISGERAASGPLRADLVPLYQRWMNDLEVARGLVTREVMTAESERAWYDQAARSTPDRAAFTIYDRADLTPVGTTALFDIDSHRRCASFGIMLGDRRDQGLGTDATRLVLEWAFTVLAIYNVDLKVWSWNARAIRTYQKAGFREIGRRRGATVVMGRRYDEVLMDVIAPEFKGTALADLIPEGGSPLA